jgi:hypothetical protein
MTKGCHIIPGRLNSAFSDTPNKVPLTALCLPTGVREDLRLNPVPATHESDGRESQLSKGHLRSQLCDRTNVVTTEVCRHFREALAEMRIGTWNLDKGRRADIGQMRRVVQGFGADVWVITEPPASVLLDSAHAVCSASAGGSQPWVRIERPGVISSLEIEDPVLDRFMAVASFSYANQDVIVVGSVLPWLAAASQAPEWRDSGRTGAALFCEVLEQHAAEVARIRASNATAEVIWAGDFNQHLHGPYHGASKVGRGALARHLESLGMTAWNARCAHNRDGLFAIDLICGQKRIAGNADRFPGDHVSDHAGYIVDIDLV